MDRRKRRFACFAYQSSRVVKQLFHVTLEDTMVEWKDVLAAWTMGNAIDHLLGYAIHLFMNDTLFANMYFLIHTCTHIHTHILLRQRHSHN